MKAFTSITFLFVFLVITFTIQAQKNCGIIKSDKEIKNILLQLRDNLTPLLPVSELSKIKKEAAKYPIKVPKEKFGLTFELDQSKSKVGAKFKPESKDWAYALIGLEYTLFSTFYEKSSRYLDIGFWCFLQAALLNLESNHLSNVGFHLNLRKEHKKTVEILCYASSQKNSGYEVHNNLGYSLASLGKVSDAFNEQSKSLNLKPNNFHLQKRYTEFANRNGTNLNAINSNLGYIPDETGFGGGPPSPAFTKIFSKLNRINFKLNKELQIDFQMYGEAAGYSYEPNSVVGNLQTDLDLSHKTYLSCTKSKPGNVYCKCELPKKRRDYSTVVHCYKELAELTDQWDTDIYITIGAAIDEMISKLNQANDLTYKERAALFKWIKEQEEFAMIQFEVSADLLEPYWLDIDGYYESLKNAETSCAGFVSHPAKRFPDFKFGKRPGKLILKRYDKGRPWHINFYFGNMVLNPDGFSEIGFDYKALKGKLKYDFETGDYGSGIGVGINAAQLINVGEAGKQFTEHVMGLDLTLGLEVDSKNGIQPGFNSGIEPKIGIHRGDYPTVSIQLLN